MEVVAFMPEAPAARFFNRDYEKTPSPEKEEEEEEDDDDDKVLDFSYLGLEYEAMKVSFAHEVAGIEERTAEARAAMDLPQFKTREDGKTMELVSQELIRAIMKSPPHPKPLPDYTIEGIRRSTGITDEEELEAISRSFRSVQSARDTQNDIIEQYRAKGYAYAVLSERYQPPVAASGN